MNHIDRFCLKHPDFGIRRLMLYIIIGNALVYLVGAMDQTGAFYSLLCFNPARFLREAITRSA